MNVLITISADFIYYRPLRAWLINKTQMKIKKTEELSSDFMIQDSTKIFTNAPIKAKIAQ